MLVRAAGRRTRRNTSLQLTQLADSLYLPFLCPAQLRWNSTHSQQAPQPRPSTRLQSSQPDKTQTRRLATVTDQHSTTSDSSRWTFGGVEYSLDPKDTLMLQHSVNDASESQRRYKNGLAGNVPDLMQNLHTCLRVERFERAVLVIERLRLQCHRDSFELQHAHNAYLTACLENIQASQQDDRLAPYDAMRDWFEIELVQKEFNVEAQILVTMMRAAMAALQGVKQERAMRRYAELAEASGILDDVCDAEDFSDDEFLRLGAVLPTLKSRSVHEAEEPIETAKEVLLDPSVQAMPQLTDMPAILEVAQKGMGLASLKQTLSHASPALQPANTPEAMEKANLTPEERQRLLEESASIAAIARWKFEEEHLQKLGIHTTLEARPLGALMWQWYSDLLPVLREEIEACRALLDGPQQPGATDDRLIYGPFVEAVPVEQLAATTILSVMGSLASGKERSSGTYNSNQRLGRLTASLGRTMQDEANAEAAKQRAIAERRAKLGRAPKKTKPKQIHPGYDTEMHVWPSDVRVKLGAMLISKLIETAKIPVTRQHPRTKEMVTQLQAAFLHKTLYESGRKQGWLCPSPDLLHKLHREPVGGLIAKRLPMVIEPRPWTNFSKGGYLNYPTPVIRFSGADAVPRDYAYAAIQRGDLEKVFEALNVLGKVPWKINENVLRVQIEAWNTGEPIANFAPLDPNIDMPPEPNKSDSKARRSWIQQVKDLENVKGGYHSQRCFQNFQLEIAKAFSKEKIYFPHNIDFRGRAYPVPPYLNHMGADNARALMTFANGKELGEVGLRWLKIHLANVYGFDKASLTEREQFAMDHLEDIRDSVANPLGGKKWWLESEDAWQTLAACYELKAAMDLPDPTKYVSYLPVHQDGTCNGLQHYAALGGDAAGARQVNLEPGDRPSDVYTAVAEGVKAEVEKDKAAGHPVAQFLHGKITRKVVKQPVMTNVYGVTYYGAREQVKKQLEEIFPEIHRHDALDHLTLASYVAKKIFKSLGEMFKGAQAIQTWLGDCADRISTCVTPEQIASIQKDDAEGKSILPTKNATPKNAGKTKATGSSLRAEASKQLFRSSVIWTTPLRLPVVQPYRSSKRRQVKTNLQNIALQEPTSIDPVSKRKQLQGFPPNFIHSLDATHMMLSAIKCNENNIAFASIHDSFWTHACDVPDLSKVLRDAFVAMHTEDVVGRLRQEFIARYKDCMYLAAVDIRTPVGKKILAAQKARPTNRGKVKQLQPALIVQLLEEVERLRLINSENPEEVAQGEELITSGSIFAEEADAEDALTVPIEIVNSRLGEIPENSDIFAASELETNDLTEPVLSDNDDVDITSDDKVAKAAEDAEAEDDAVPTLESLKAKRVNGAKKEQVRKVFVWLPLKFPEVPEKGDFDVTRLKESQYFFH